MAESVSARDLRAMMNLVHDGYADEPADGLPAAVVEVLSRLVPCDSVCFFELSPGHRHFLSENTVRKHLENIYERLGVSSRTAAVARAFQSGYIT